jgi:hypothetical protein
MLALNNPVRSTGHLLVINEMNPSSLTNHCVQRTSHSVTAPITLQLWTVPRSGDVGQGMTNASPSSVILNAAAGPGRLFSFCSSLALPSPSPLRSPICVVLSAIPIRVSVAGRESIHIDAREPRKARHFPHTFTAVGVETPPNVDQRANKLNGGSILLISSDPLAYIPLRREGGQKRRSWVPRLRIYTFDAFALS